ncbi:23S rRNA pseudouridine(1911/1915/1917) synthase RluD [Candidatus Thioglobus sp. NP1]|uniref:23S rRNA pseudouridine(1911/1915/1917) synthase RluD n=1 Tax=Candidatus Thioglobus sp. NP1 TaxID=2508687 RepID=UPI000DED5261|nr:23S rRNA pseudouridine(1911/1915/1917) synthase RluD [Candidatus Thioglobus sp. NP1]AXE61833.1 23S rRNA pseudouridine(1911/1915/1917) synthase RluD [Candidatus Thioglobus sp. NP1]
MKILNIIIPNRMIGNRLDSSLSIMLPDYSRSKITAWIKSGDALINQKTFKPKDKVNGSEVVNLTLNQKQNNNWIAEKIPLNIIYEDEDIIVINKKFGLVTHPGAGNWSGTLANALLYYDSSLSILARAGIVHRLDKNTSGLMVVARNEKSQKHLIEQLQNHSIQREYSAIVYGHMIAGGTVDEPIGRDPKDRVKQAVTISGKAAVTHFRAIDRFKSHTHVKAILETGRTHQIRVHLSHVGHSLVGDPVYGGRVRFPKKASVELKEALINFKRQALHSKKLTLMHPVSGEQMSWKAPLPDDMQKLLDILKKYDS